uniref:SPOR domain-containing protein n=1 Tax=Methylobacterium sp. Leaf118 TaxID=2876562 RepID=UPI001E3A8DBB
MTGHASRATVDFDAFERELRQSGAEARAEAQPGAKPAAKSADPLAELARIVGQDDPFRALLEAREKTPAPAGAGRPGRVEPTFVDAPAPPQDRQPAMTAPNDPPAAQGTAHGASQSPADAFDQYLASVEQGLYANGQPDDPAAFAEAEAGYRAGPVERPRGRGRLVQVGAGLAVLAVCVGGALAWRGTHGGGSGGPITVLADKTPLKVQPAATDGVEIPDQNKQIYDRTAKDGQIRIVNREEQPLDVNQAARSATARSEGTNPGQGGATPGQGGLLTDSLGEPRRVRTVSVKPDTPVLNPPQAQAQAPAQAHSEAAPVSPIPTMTLPDSGTTPAATPRRPSRTLASAPAADA